MAFIIDTTNQQVISPSDLFGNESNSLLEACYRIFQGSLYPYKGVYNSPFVPASCSIVRNTWQMEEIQRISSTLLDMK